MSPYYLELREVLANTYPGETFSETIQGSGERYLLHYMNCIEALWNDNAAPDSFLSRLRAGEISHLVLFEDAEKVSREQRFKSGSISFNRVLTAYHFAVAIFAGPARNLPKLRIDVAVDISDLSEADPLRIQYVSELASQGDIVRSRLNLYLYGALGSPTASWSPNLTSLAPFVPRDLDHEYAIGKYTQSIRQSLVMQIGTEGTSQHSLFNVLGPFIASLTLHEKIASALHRNDFAKRAFLRCITWLYNCGAPRGIWIRDEELARDCELKGDAKLALVVVDDQIGDGWQTVVEWAFDHDSTKADLRFHTDPSVLLQSLDEIKARPDFAAIKKAHEGGQYPLRNSTMSFAKGATRHAKMLVLDLRLFSRDPNGFSELGFFERVLTLLEDFGLLYQSNVGRGIDRVAFARLADWLATQRREKVPARTWRNEGVYLEALTLLPRLIASVDDTLPIIIFSSTRQRAVTELLKPFHSVLTDFRKPGWGEYVEPDQPFDFREGFRRAMNHAARYCRLRRRLSRVAENRLNMNLPRAKGDRYVEVFFDESGTPGKGRFVQAALVVVYVGDKVEGLRDAQELSGLMQAKAVTLRDGSGGTRLVKFSWIKQQLDKKVNFSIAQIPRYDATSHANAEILFKELNGLGRIELCFGYTLTAYTQDHKQLAATDESGVDPTLYALIRHATEAVVFDLIPAVVEGDVEVGLRYATRNWTPSDPGLFRILENRFGFEERRDFVPNSHIFTIVSRTGHAIYEAARRSRMQQTGPPRIHSCKAVALSLARAQSLPDREVHYLADLMASAALQWEKFPPESLLRAFSGSNAVYFRDQLSLDGASVMDGALSASRNLKSGKSVAAWLIALDALKARRPHSYGMSSLVFSEIHSTLPALTSDEVRLLAKSV